MPSFQRKIVNTKKSLGEILKTARQKKHFGLSYIAKSLNIPLKYLDALEQSKYNKLPSEVYARNYLNSYCKFLGLDFKLLYKQFKVELDVFQKTGISEVDRPIPPQKASSWSFFHMPKLIKGVVVLIILLAVLSYLGFKIKAIFSPPKLIIESPTQDLVITENQIEISGKTSNSVILKINGRQILPDNIGRFNEIIILQDGMNKINITAKKRYSQEAIIERVIQVVD